MTRNPTPTMLEPAAPPMVVSAVTLITVSPVMAPETKQTAGTSCVAQAVSSSRDVTVVTAADPPPVVPPFWVAYPISQASLIDPVAEPVEGVLELEDEDPPVLVVLLVKVPVATEETASAVLVAAESLSHLATRGAALTAAAIKAKVETAFVNFILTDVYVCCCGEKRLLG